MQAVRIEDDAAFVADPDGARPRDRQLLLIFDGLPPDPAHRVLNGTGRVRADRPWRNVSGQPAGPVRDDPAVLPPAMRGQQALFTVPRCLSKQTAQRILHRPVAGLDDALRASAEFAAEHGLGPAWQHMVGLWLRVALALRDADGHDVLPQETLDDLPRMGQAVSQILQRANLLRPRAAALPPARFTSVKAGYGGPSPPPRSCVDCDTWMSYTRNRCRACQSWRSSGHPLGRCVRCHRDDAALRNGYCRGCHWHLSTHGPDTAGETFTQLRLGEPLPPPARARKNPLDRPAGGLRPATGDAARAPSAHLEVPGQQVLFATRRDWSPLIGRRTEDLPALTAPAQQLLEHFEQVMRDQRWEASRRYASLRTLTVIVSWLGADAPIAEADVHALAGLDGSMTAKRACSILHTHGLLAPDPDRHRDRNKQWIDPQITRFPQPIAAEVRRWVLVLRGEGRWEHPALGYDSIRRYLAALQPVLEGWMRQGVTSLREITHEQVAQAIAARRGNAARAVHNAVRSCFRALKQERMIFRDPSQGLTMAAAQILPQSVPSDLLAGLLDHTAGALQRLIIALVTIHALPGHEIANLLADDLNLAAGRQVVRRRRLRHTLYLEELTHRLAAEWLAERHRHWPVSTNPHLLVTGHTALDPEGPCISVEVLRKTFLPMGLTMRQLREDRILHDAQETADPLRLTRLFGINDGTATHYISAAHPETPPVPARALR